MVTSKHNSTLILVETTIWIVFLSKDYLGHTYLGDLGDLNLHLVRHLVWVICPDFTGTLDFSSGRHYRPGAVLVSHRYTLDFSKGSREKLVPVDYLFIG